VGYNESGKKESASNERDETESQSHVGDVMPAGRACQKGTMRLAAGQGEERRRRVQN
jgi:hypothetical protein